MTHFNAAFLHLMRRIGSGEPAPLALDAQALATLDAEGMLCLAAGNGVVALPEASAAMRDRLGQWRLRDRLHADVVTRIDRALGAAGIKAIVFKGEALARSHYREGWWRPRTDIDLWIAECDLDAALVALAGAGFRLVRGLASRFARFEVVLDAGLQVPVGIDLHVRPFFRPWRLRGLDLAAVLGNAGPLSGCTHLRQPGDAEALVLAAVHLDKNLHPRAIWLHDLFLLGRDPETRQSALELAGRHGEGAVVAAALAEADRVFLGPDNAPAPRVAARPGRLAAMARDLGALPGWRARLVFLGELFGIGVRRWPG